MYRVEIPLPNLQQAAIKRRQKLDEERKKRIFDPKTRVFGIDVKALDEQLRIKTEIKHFDQERDAAYHKYNNYTNQILTLMDDQTAQARRTHLQKMNDFRAAHQTPEKGRDFDLIDPQARLKDLPARVGDDDPRCGVSGLQKFEGEDLEVRGRSKEQKEQMRVWVQKQMWEKRQREEMEAEVKRKYEVYQKNVGLKATALQNAMRDAKLEQNRIDNEYNQYLAALKKQREHDDRERELQQNMQEILSSVNGIFLTETPDVTNIKGGHKIRVDLFKGITPEQKEEALRIQAYQREENERKRDAKRADEARYALQQAATNRALILLEREKERKAKELAVQIREENIRKASEDRKRQNYIDKVLYTNPPTNAYFEQFNTTSR
ncbi:RIB43A-domain-containing protein [Chytriomyces sp. MP71]|nr:RIB43A-domain-containing protein [Chytriomyces sp. MP71]